MAEGNFPDRELIYEDDEIIVIYRKGESDFLLVTFGDLVTRVNGLHFFADTPCEKLGVSAVGFVAKKGNWYPSANMSLALERVRPLLSNFSEIIGYGGSMGGYAAVKYSALLGSRATLALCPQWSIDRGEWDGMDPGWQTYFGKSMCKMGIRSQDIGGAVLVIADMFHNRDCLHALRIGDQSCDVNIVNCPGVTHHVTTVLAGTANLQSMIDGVRTGRRSVITNVIRNSRMYHRRRVENIIKKMIIRHPDVLVKKLNNLIATDLWERFRFSSAMLDRLALFSKLRSERQIEKRVLEWKMDRQGNASGVVSAALQMQISTGRPMYIRTCHGTHLYYDLEKGTVRHGSAPPAYAGVPISFENVGSTIVFCLKSANLMLRLGRLQDGSIGIFSPGDAASVEADMVWVGPGRIALRFGDKYLSAGRNGIVVADRSECRAWETFGFAIVE